MSQVDKMSLSGYIVRMLKLLTVRIILMFLISICNTLATARPVVSFANEHKHFFQMQKFITCGLFN